MPVKKHNRMPALLGDFFYDQWPEMFYRRGTTPQINVIETDKKFKVEIAAPGMAKEDFKVELTPDNQLVVYLEKVAEKGDDAECKECDDDKRHYLRRDFAYVSFRQVFNLPDNVDRDNITAKMKHGVLHIKLPKRVGADTPHDVKLISVE